jgi:hypothetical protein
VVPRTIVRQFGVQNRFRFGVQNGFPFGVQNGFRFNQNGFRFDRDGQLLKGSPIVIWPSWPFFDTTPIQVPQVASDAPSNPVVIVMSGLSDRAPERAIPETPPDYGYVAGCHAIPNGYHCDVPPNSATP